jgi:hypothetical protein
MKEINEENYKNLQTRALIRATRPDTRSSFRGGFRGSFHQSRGGGHSGYYNEQRREHYDNSNRCDSDKASCSNPVIPQPAVSSQREGVSPEGDTPCPQPVFSEDFTWEEKQLEEQKRIAVGGRLRFFWKAWREIGALKKIARYLNRGYRLPFFPGGESEARSLLSTSCPKK